jgi:hypothetical protein
VLEGGVRKYRIYIVLSIFLRQENSPESKPVGASDAQTGGANE